MIKKLIVPGIAAALLTACTPAQFESPPVTLDTPQGPVTCQLYTKSMLDWDRSTDRPDTMSVETADALCKQEGRREQSGG